MSVKIAVSLLFLTINVFKVGADTFPCAKRTAEYGTICVCNSTYCDTVPTIANLSSGEYQLYSTSESTSGFSSATGNLSSKSSLYTIEVDVDTTHQTMLGFGGAFTDATGINVMSLSEGAQNNLVNSYWGENGIQYSLGRVPIAATDFSLRFYTYCDDEDPTLETFALQAEDLTYKIPLIQKAIELRKASTNGTLKLFSSVWTAPAWMKNVNGTNGILKDEYYQVWADYFIKFFDAYSEYNISFWGTTTQNEPVDGFSPEKLSGIPGLGWLPSWMEHWVGTYLGPTIRNSSYSDIKIILHDDQRILLPFLQPDLEYDAEGWLEWNMALNTSGGPTYIDNNVDSSIIVNATAGEFYKQPMYYVMGHFSKFVVPGSVRLGCDVSLLGDLFGLRALAFRRPDNLIAVVIYNSQSSNATVQLTINGTTGSIVVGASSLSTLLYAI